MIKHYKTATNKHPLRTSISRWLVTSTLIVTSAASLSNTAYGQTGALGYCQIFGNEPAFTYNVTVDKTIDDPRENMPGAYNSQFYQWSSAAQYFMTCDCPPNEDGSPPLVGEVFFRAEVPGQFQLSLPGGLDGQEMHYYSVTNEIFIATQLYIAGGRNEYISAPFDSISNQNFSAGGSCAASNYATGSRGNVGIYFNESFAGSKVIPPTQVLTLYASTRDSSFSGIPVVRVMLSGTITVNQSCSLEGQTLQVPFGDILANDIKDINQPANGVLPYELDINVSCHNVNDEAFNRYSVTLNGTPIESNSSVLSTTNDDIGIVIEDVLGGGDPIPVTGGSLFLPGLGGIYGQDNPRDTTARIRAYPINTTGNTPQTGDFTGTATLQIEFE